MSETMKHVLAALRSQVNQLRDEYCEALFYRKYGLHRSSSAAHTTLVCAQRKLGFLVPLLRALNATAQQTVTGGDAGRRLYHKKYDALCYRIRDVLTYGYLVQGGQHGYRVQGGQHDMHFGGIEALEVMVPEVGVAPAEWEVVRIDALIQRCIDGLAAERREALKRQMAAEDARKAFLASLTADQRTLLTVALDAAKAKGTRAVSFDQRDL